MAPRPPPPALASAIRNAARSYPITLTYLFGSHARGTADEDSDVDLGILADAGMTKGDRHDLRLRLMRAFAEALDVPCEKMDVVMLQDVPVLLQYNVIRNGEIIAARDRSAQRGYEIEVERRYDDERPMLEQETNLTLDRILAHRV